MVDRVPTYPGRVTLTDIETGVSKTYDMVLADQPVVDGTPMNAANLCSAATAELYGLSSGAGPSDALRVIMTPGNGKAYVTAGAGNGGTLGEYATAEGRGTTASDQAAHAEGWVTTASGHAAHAEGSGATASGSGAHAEGNSATASGSGAHAEGWGTTASGQDAHAEGNSATASGQDAHAEGFGTTASGNHSHAGGNNTIASARSQTAIGEYNIENSSASNALIVGMGASDTARSNCFRVTYAGVYGAGAYNASGADYAEMFEWADGNPDGEDRAGRFVTLDGEYIRLAEPQDDFILGVVSGSPSVCGDVYDDQWQGMYIRDIFGRPVWETVTVPGEYIDIPDPECDGETMPVEISPEHEETRLKVNPNYDGEQLYKKRSERPEWDAVGMLGKLVALDDGTCAVNGWAAPGAGGIATSSAQKSRWRVMARLDETHVRLLCLI